MVCPVRFRFDRFDRLTLASTLPAGGSIVVFRRPRLRDCGTEQHFLERSHCPAISRNRTRLRLSRDGLGGHQQHCFRRITQTGIWLARGDARRTISRLPTVQEPRPRYLVGVVPRDQRRRQPTGGAISTTHPALKTRPRTVTLFRCGIESLHFLRCSSGSKPDGLAVIKDKRACLRAMVSRCCGKQEHQDVYGHNGPTAAFTSAAAA